MADYGIVADARDALSAASQGEREQDKRKGSEEILKAAREDYDRAVEAWSENREAALDDIRFARLGEQWPDKVADERKRDNRPMLTVNRLPRFIRQVVN